MFQSFSAAGEFRWCDSCIGYVFRPRMPVNVSQPCELNSHEGFLKGSRFSGSNKVWSTGYSGPSNALVNIEFGHLRVGLGIPLDGLRNATNKWAT